MCVCEREREREKEREGDYVCVREREREIDYVCVRERARFSECALGHERGNKIFIGKPRECARKRTRELEMLKPGENLYACCLACQLVCVRVCMDKEGGECTCV